MSPSPDRAPLSLPDAPPAAVPANVDEVLRSLGVPLDANAIAQMARYLGLLLAMNERMNLTAPIEPASAWQRHIFDSLTLAPLLDDGDVDAAEPRTATAPCSRLVDVGSGGGLPGIPLAIARPDLSVTLVESTQKKAAFLRDVADALGLTNVEVLSERAELLAETALGQAADVVTARAVAALDKLVPWTAPLARHGGKVLLIKGQRADDELRAAATVMRKYRVELERVVPTPTGRIVVLRKKG